MASIGQKADHVRARIAEGKAGNHHCHWPGCDKKVPPAQWGCRKHWYMLPIGLRSKIWAAYRIGQESDKKPSDKYVGVARQVRSWIKEHHGVE
jgi:hypothetical protein